MKKKLLILLYLPLVYILFFLSCTPRIKFTIKTGAEKKQKLYIKNIKDSRPPNERVGYKIFYVDSISDKDYEKGFLNEFSMGMKTALSETFFIVKDEKESKIKLTIDVRHFYGEYSQSVKTVLYEYGSCLLLFIPRLVTDAIPYNYFAGRAVIDSTFTMENKKAITKTIDLKLTETVSSYKRGSADTTSRLSDAVSPKLDKIIKDILNET